MLPVYCFISDVYISMTNTKMSYYSSYLSKVDYVILNFRYLAICHPMEVKISKRACRLTIVSIWIAAFVILIPWAVYYKLTVWQPSRGNAIILCYQDWPKEEYQKNYFLGAIFLCCYSVPLVLIVVCYSLIGFRVWKRKVPGAKNSSLDIVHKSKVNAVKMLAVVVVMFAFSWLPLYALRLKTLFGTPSSKDVETVLLNIVNPIAQWLGSSNSGMNPIIYLFFSKRYRRGFQESINCCHNEKKRRLQPRTLSKQLAAHSFINGSSNKSRLTFVLNRIPSESNSTTTTTQVWLLLLLFITTHENNVLRTCLLDMITSFNSEVHWSYFLKHLIRVQK